jgi:Sugar (and other) transporter
MIATTIALGPSPMSEVEHQSALRHAVIASTVGTTIEWYDFLIYSTVTGLVFNKVYFPGSDPWVGTLQAVGVYFVGFVARPIGAAIFGHYGDRIGRKATLIVTLLMTGIATAAVGLVPGYDSIGIWGAVILVVLRLIQGIERPLSRWRKGSHAQGRDLRAVLLPKSSGILTSKCRLRKTKSDLD